MKIKTINLVQFQFLRIVYLPKVARRCYCGNARKPSSLALIIFQLIFKRGPSSTHHKSEKKISTSFCSNCNRNTSYINDIQIQFQMNQVNQSCRVHCILNIIISISSHSLTLRKIHFKEKKNYSKSKNCNFLLFPCVQLLCIKKHCYLATSAANMNSRNSQLDGEIKINQERR